MHDVALFCESVLPRFFQHANWTSFTRQLANYSFVHVRDTDDAWVFEHPHFSRTAAADLPLVVRRKTNQKETAANAANDDATDTSVDDTAAKSSAVITRKRSFAQSTASTAAAAAAAPPPPSPSTEMLAQHHALLQSLHKKLDVQIANQERVLHSQARIVELLEAQERRHLMRQLDGSSLFASSNNNHHTASNSSSHVTSAMSLFDLDSDTVSGTNVFCPIHSQTLNI